jgi:hypothetical protein
MDAIALLSDCEICLRKAHACICRARRDTLEYNAAMDLKGKSVAA